MPCPLHSLRSRVEQDTRLKSALPFLPRPQGRSQPTGEPTMKLLTRQHLKQLLLNGTRALNDPTHDPLPVAKLFTPDGSGTWLLASLDPYDLDTAFGLCDLGMGSPELGTVSLTELKAVRGQLGLPIERDRHWQATHSLSAYAAASKERIVDRL
jgi:hypothetical protein